MLCLLKAEDLEKVKQFRKDAATYLETGIVTGNFKPEYGTCSNLSIHLGYTAVTDFSGWEHYSGNSAYPVPDLTGNKRPDMEFYHSLKWEGQYGRLRLDLLDWLIATAQ